MNWLEPVFERVWQISLSATVLIALGWLVILIFGRRMPTWARYGIWVLVFLRLMLPVVPPAGFSVWNLGRVEGKPVVRQADNSARGTPVVFERPAGYKPAIQQIENLRYEKSVISVLWVVGMAAWVVIAVVRHRRVAKWVRGQGKCGDERVLSVLDRARAAFKVRKEVAVIVNERFEVPAVFGLRRPVLLLPEAWLKEADDQELYGVLLHEMAHVKCRDALLNWVFILLRSVHWFNPLVWYAFHRLRAERELFCDALVLKRLRAPERSVYGSTLLRIAAQLSGATAPPTLVPILQQKPEIHRRIHMIAKYKSTPWLLSAAFALLLIALVGITFTRAADKATSPAATPAQDRAKSLDVLERELRKQQETVRKLQSETSELAEKLGGAEKSGPETLEKLRAQRLEAQAELTRLNSLHTHLSKQKMADLRQSISTAMPDNQLSTLMQQHDQAEQKMADLLEERAPAHPEVRRSARVLQQIDKQIDARIEGMMRGLQAQLSAADAHVQALNRALDEAIAQYRDSLQRARPYQEALQELRAQEELLQRLRMRMLDERINSALEGTRQK